MTTPQCKTADEMVEIMRARFGEGSVMHTLAVTQARHAGCIIADMPVLVPVDAWGRAYRGMIGEIVGHTEVIS